MSGGSYNHLYARDLGDMFANDDDLQRMADRLACLGYAKDAARETMSTLLEIRAARVRIEVRMDRLNAIWRAVEMWDSCDSGEDGVKHALDKYRGKSEPS